VKEQTAPAPQTEHHSQQGLALPLALVQEGLYKDLAAI